MLTGFNGAGHAVRLEFSSDDVAARDGLIIGRSSQQSDLVLDDTSVSRRHARLFTGHGLLQIEDLESANGTSVDGRVLGVEEIAELGEGAELIFGETKLRLSIS
ncbi:MAG: FHA domain-containing protein [Alphaproteobacteria bacterium]|nr:FHA domain-containing protein [Alphaproteobacteria bacterium]